MQSWGVHLEKTTNQSRVPLCVYPKLIDSYKRVEPSIAFYLNPLVVSQPLKSEWCYGQGRVLLGKVYSDAR